MSHSQSYSPEMRNDGHDMRGPANAEPRQPRRRFLRAIWFVFRAIEIRLRFIALLVAISLLVGYWETIKNHIEKWHHTYTSAGSVQLGPDVEFYCPMHPQVVRSELDPGGKIPSCPICGMPLSKRKKGESAPLAEGVVSRVQFSPQQIQAAGIRTHTVELRPLVYRIRTVGTVVYDETTQMEIVSRVHGYVEKLYVNQTFQEVKSGEPLAEIYSPELYSAIEELRLALDRRHDVMAEAARRKLRLLGVADSEIDAAAAARDVYRLVLRAPHGGTVTAKRVLEGAAVQPGQTLFELADLRTVWVMADVYERDVAWVRPHQEAQLTVAAYPDHPFPAEVAVVYPQVNERTRTNRVRFVVSNPDQLLRPGMYVTVHVDVPLAEVEPFRSLKVVGAPASADDEASRIARQKKCPVTGARLGSMGKPVPVHVEDQLVYLCCVGCRQEFEAAPQKMLQRLVRVSDNGVLAVPEDAVIDTGEHHVVYVERQPGFFEGVAVQLGPRAEGYYAVLDGLWVGDRVAAAGAFLIDAETRLNPAAASTYFGASGHQHD